MLLSGISGSRVARAKIWRGVSLVYRFRAAMRLEAIGPAGRCRGGVVEVFRFRRPRVTLLLSPSRAREARPWSAVATGSLANVIGRAKTAEGLGRAPLRHFGLARRAWENLARRKFGLSVGAAIGSRRSGRLGGAAAA